VQAEPVAAVTGQSLGTIDMPRDYILSFDITPHGVVTSWGNLMHFSQTNQNNNGGGSRMPGIWLNPGEFRLCYAHDLIDRHNYYAGTCGGDGIYLAVGETHNMQISNIGRQTQIILNGEVVRDITLPNDRWYGDGTAIFYFTDPWYDAADATIENVNIVSY
jgi:hypothetical protein